MTRLAIHRGLFAAAAVLAATLAVPTDAAACGGCFAPIGSPTVVTRHQMAVALSPTETTLWDQIEYAGNPEDFVWVLPVRGGVAVELAENTFFEALQGKTAIQLQAPLAPVTFCPDPCGGFAAASAAPRGDEYGDVTVYHEATIGPYETVTIGSEDPAALVAWLQERDYTVPDAILPTITHYTDQGMDFAVLRLAPNAGVNQMQPVRVSMPGMNPTFPLRMVAAGVEGSVGLELFVLAEGRYEATNFAATEVDRDALTYDWNSGIFNYDDLYDEAASAEGGRAWVTEFAGPATDVQDFRSYDELTGEWLSPTDDWAVVTRNIADPYLTRLTADLAVEFLDQDLILGASRGGDLPSVINVTNELNRGEDIACTTVCTDPYVSGGPGSVGWRDGGRGDGLCTVRPGRSGGSTGLGLLMLVGAVTALGLRRRE